MKHAPSADSKTGQSGQIARKIEQAIQRKLFVLDTDMKLFATTFEISWELQRCIQDELDGDYDLGPVLTISGDSSHFWATSCLEYVEHAWPTVGSAFLELLRRTAGFTQKEEINPKGERETSQVRFLKPMKHGHK